MKEYILTLFIINIFLSFSTLASHSQDIEDRAAPHRNRMVDLVHICFAKVMFPENDKDCIGDATNYCQMQGLTDTRGIVQCNVSERQIWSGIRHRNYKELLSISHDLDFKIAQELQNHGSSEPYQYSIMVETLAAEEHAWKSYKKAVCASKASRHLRGTIYPVTLSGCDLHMEATRAIDLRQRLDELPK